MVLVTHAGSVPAPHTAIATGGERGTGVVPRSVTGAAGGRPAGEERAGRPPDGAPIGAQARSGA